MALKIIGIIVITSILVSCGETKNLIKQREPMTNPNIRVIHTEFQSKDAGKTAAFLSAMSGRKSKSEETGAGTLFSFDSGNATGVAIRNAADHEGGPGTTVYFETSSIEATLKLAVENGATLMVPKMTYAGHGYIAWVEAPGGVRLAYLERDESVSTTGEFVK